MISSRSYLIRAIYDWIVDNGWTPHMVVDAERDDVKVPIEHVQDGKIVLNVIPRAVNDLDLGNEWISFSARFSGKPFELYFPPHAVKAIFASENSEGMVFPDEPEREESEGDEPETIKSKKGDGKPTLRVIK